MLVVISCLVHATTAGACRYMVIQEFTENSETSQIAETALIVQNIRYAGFLPLTYCHMAEHMGCF
jgi:hypothetical protein